MVRYCGDNAAAECCHSGSTIVGGYGIKAVGGLMLHGDTEEILHQCAGAPTPL